MSPVKNPDGKVVGASKIARDITERRRAEQQQRLLLREMDHRIKNLFALASGVVALSARSATTAEELSSAVRDRLVALARAHALTLPVTSEGGRRIEQSTTLHALIQTILSPYKGRTEDDGGQVTISGPDIRLGGGSLTGLALLLHEFATNAAKYGALSTPSGHIDIACSDGDGQFALTWTERGGPRVDHQSDGEGFGALLARATVNGQSGGRFSRDWKPEGLTIRTSGGLKIVLLQNEPVRRWPQTNALMPPARSTELSHRQLCPYNRAMTKSTGFLDPAHRSRIPG